MLFAIISAVLAYRKAKDTGRNGFLWAVIAAATFIGTQLVVALILGLALGVIIVSTNGTDADFDKFGIVLSIIAVIISFISTWAVLKYLDRVPEPDNFTTPPPPPQNFS
jgi:hypothetical protein